MAIDESAQEKAILDAQLRRGSRSLLSASDRFVQNGGDISTLYGGTPYVDPFPILDFFGSGGGYAKPGDIKKALGSFAVNATSGVAASLMEQSADRLEMENPTLADTIKNVRDGDLMAIWDYVSNFTIDPMSPTLGMAPESKWVNDAMEKFGIADTLRQKSTELKDWNIRFMAENDLLLGPDEEPTLLYNVVSGGASLMASLGIAVVTKSPTVAATVFGTIQQTDAYEAYRNAGSSVEKSQAMSIVEGLTMGYMEAIGSGQWMNTIIGRGSSPLRGMMRGALVNFQEEFSQAGAQEFFRKAGGINDNTALESLGSMLGQGFVGGLVGAPVGGITGPIESRGIKKASLGGDYREALAETLIGRLGDDMLTDLEMRIDASSGKATTETGKRYNEMFEQIISIAKAFNDGVDISTEYQTEQQKKELVDDIIKRAGESRNRKMVDEKAGRRRQLKEQEADLLDKISSVEQEGAEFVEKFLDNVKEIGYSDETIQAIEDAIYMVGLAQESAVEAIDSGADSAEIEFSDIMEFIDDAELRAEIDTLREDMIIEDALTGTPRYINIQRKAGKLNEKLRVLREEMATLESATDAELESIIGKEYVKIRGNVVEKVRKNEAINSFVKGFREGKKFSDEQITSVQSALMEGINSLKGTGVSDKLIARLMRRIPRTKTPKNLESLINKIDVLVEADIVRSIKEQSKLNTNKLIKQYKSKTVNSKKISKLDARISDAIDLMHKAQKGIAKGTRRKEGESMQDYRYRKADKVMGRMWQYEQELMRLASNEQNDPMPSNAKNIAMAYISSLVVDPTVSEQIAIEESIKGLVGVGRDVRNESVEKIQVEVDRATKQVIKAMETKKKRDPRSLRNRIMESLTQPGNLIVKTYNTILEQMGISDIEVLKGMEDLNLQNAENRMNNDNKLVELIKDTVGTKYFQKEYHNKGVFFRDEIKIGKSRVLEYLQNAEDVGDAKGVVVRYINHRKGQEGFGDSSLPKLRQEVYAAESIDDLMSLVENMVADRRSSYTIDWSKGEHIYWYMLLQNEQLRESIMAPWGDMAMSEELVAEIESELTAQDKKLAEALFKEYEIMYGKINEVYRRINGVSLPKVDFYTPISREAANGSDAPLDPVNDFTHYISSSFTKVRTQNAIQIKDQDAVMMFIKHMRNAQHYVDYAEWFEKATRVVASTSRDIINKHGAGLYNVLVEHINDLESANNVELNTQFNIIDYLRKTFMLSTLGMNPQIGIKQLTSIFALADGMSSTDFVSYVNEFMENPYQNFKMMRQHITWRGRGERFNKELDKIINDKKMQVGGKFTFQDFFMLSTRIGDAIPVYLGGYAQFRNAQANGASTREALNIAAKKVEASQQTSTEANLSLFQKRDDTIYKTIGMFTSSPLALLNMELQAFYQYKNGTINDQQFARKLAIYHIVIPAFFTWVASAFDADEEEYAKSFLLGTTGSVPIFSAPIDLIATYGINAGSEAMGRDNQLPIFTRTLGDNPLVDAASKPFRLNMRDAIHDVTSGDPITMAEGISSIVEAIDWLTVAPLENTADMTAGAIKIFTDNEDPVEGTLQLMGFSEYTLDQDER